MILLEAGEGSTPREKASGSHRGHLTRGLANRRWGGMGWIPGGRDAGSCAPCSLRSLGP